VEANNPEKKLTQSVAKTADQLGISLGQAYEGVRTGEIPSFRVGKRILVPLVALDRLLEGAK
jgi:excisionase family DNA binding protein